MSDEGGTGADPTPDEGGDTGFGGPPPWSPPGQDATAAYGATPAQVAPQAPPAGSTSPYQAPPKSTQAPTPFPTAVQPLPGYSPPAQAPPYGEPFGGTRAGVRWNIWAGVVAAVALAASGSLWRLGKLLPDVLHIPFREQVGYAISVSHALLGVATLAALAAKGRTPLAILGAMLGITALMDVTYGWYNQMDQVYRSFSFDFVMEYALPDAMSSYVLAFATMLAATLARVHPTGN